MTTQDTPTPEINLLPCPFCSGIDLKLFGESAPEWWVTCQSCFASGRTSASRTRAAEAWNRRATQLDRQQRGDPIGFIKQEKFDWITAPGRDKTGACIATITRSASDAYTIPVFSTPQPASPAQPAHKVAGRKIGPDTYEAIDAPAREVSDNLEDAIDAVSKAMRKAWQLGQTYWQQADSESWSQNKKSDETHDKFNNLVEETCALLTRCGAAQPAASVEPPQEIMNLWVGTYDTPSMVPVLEAEFREDIWPRILAAVAPVAAQPSVPARLEFRGEYARGWNECRDTMLNTPPTDGQTQQDADRADALTDEDVQGFITAYENFDDGVDTTVGIGTLQKLVAYGLLQADRFSTTASGEAFYAAHGQQGGQS